MYIHIFSFNFAGLFALITKAEEVPDSNTPRENLLYISIDMLTVFDYSLQFSRNSLRNRINNKFQVIYVSNWVLMT